MLKFSLQILARMITFVARMNQDSWTISASSNRLIHSVSTIIHHPTIWHHITQENIPAHVTKMHKQKYTEVTNHKFKHDTSTGWWVGVPVSL